MKPSHTIEDLRAIVETWGGSLSENITHTYGGTCVECTIKATLPVGLSWTSSDCGSGRLILSSGGHTEETRKILEDLRSHVYEHIVEGVSARR